MGVSTCRVCRGKTLDKFLSLGLMPLANGFLREDQLSMPEPYYPSEPQNPEAIAQKVFLLLQDEGSGGEISRKQSGIAGKKL